MFMYGLIIVLTGLFALFLTPTSGQKRSFYYFATIMLWSLIFATIAFRAEEIGADTINYINKYLLIKDLTNYSQYGGTAAGEPLFFLLNKFLSHVFGPWAQCIIIVEAIAVVGAYSWAFKKYSINAIFSILGFLALGLYLTSLCLLRQFIAISICVYSIRYIVDKKPWHFYVCVVLAMLIHYSAIFWGVTYLACNSFNNNKSIKYLFYLAFAVFGYFTVDLFLETTAGVFEKWSGWSANAAVSEGYISFAIFALITLFVFFYRESIISMYPYADIMININYLNFILWTMRLVTRNTERVSFYFTIAPILLVPVLCKAIEKKHGSAAGTMFKAVIVFSMMVLFWIKATKDPSLYPYMFMQF